MGTQTKKKVQIGFDELFNDLIPIIKNSLYCCGCITCIILVLKKTKMHLGNYYQQIILQNSKSRYNKKK